MLDARHNSNVIPAKLAAIPPEVDQPQAEVARAGIQAFQRSLDARLRGHDGKKTNYLTNFNSRALTSLAGVRRVSAMQFQTKKSPPAREKT